MESPAILAFRWCASDSPFTIELVDNAFCISVIAGHNSFSTALSTRCSNTSNKHPKLATAICEEDAMALDLTQHPCFNSDVRHRTGRIHLPVAPRCNIQCNYCDRKFDCANESRPGVTSSVLTPKQALDYLDRALERVPYLKVVGIAGPGDPFANPEETIETLLLVREKYPEMLLCVATNGLNAEPYVKELARLEVSHVTCTVNAINPAIGAQIYAWVRDGRAVYRNEPAASLLWERQKRAIEALKSNGVIVKVNTIVVPGINDTHIEDIAVEMRALGVDIMNCIPLYPVKDTLFEDREQLGSEPMRRLRKAVQ